MAVSLRITKGRGLGQRFVLEEGKPSVLGRSKNADITVSDPLLSRSHCRIELSAELWVLTDLRSSNGTQVNGLRIEEHKLVDGDTIKIGTTVLRFEVLPTSTETGGASSARVLFCSRCFRALPSSEANQIASQTEFVCVSCMLGANLDPGFLPGIELVEKVAVGEMGPVYRARHLRLGRDVSIRFLLSKQNNLRHLDIFLRMSKIYGSLVHPNILEMLDATEHRGVYYIITAFIDGETAKDQLDRDGALSLGETIDLGVSVAHALDYAFRRQVVHRDVKPEHVHIGADGCIRLTGFGLAKCFEEAGLSGITRPGEGKGTLFYMAPEQISNAVSSDWRADIYALGATMYHCICGEPPFADSSLGKAIRNVITGQRVPLLDHKPDLPEKFCQIIDRSMKLNPADRYESAAAIAEDLLNL